MMSGRVSYREVHVKGNLAVAVLVGGLLIWDLVSTRGVDGALSIGFATELTALACAAVCAWLGAQKLRATGHPRVLRAFQVAVVVSLGLLVFGPPGPRSDATLITFAALAGALILPTAVWLERRARPRPSS
jgi:hypothetical protein